MIESNAVRAQWAYLTAGELVAMLAKQEISSLELLESCIARIMALDKAINAVVARDFDHAREAAQQADIALARGERLPLLGLPVTVKEAISVKGIPTTWGQPAFKDWMPNEDSLAVERLKAAGAIVIGKTNIPLMLGDYQTYNPLFGVTNNPWDLNMTCGGSSGGAAAAVAAGFIPLELGTDLASSLRVPAHFCGVYAHRPSVDAIPTRGIVPPGPQMMLEERGGFQTVGPLARSAVDLDLALKVLAGPDSLTDGRGYQLCLPPARHAKLSDYRVLFLDTHPLVQVSKSVKTALTALESRLDGQGCNIVRTSDHLPDLATVARLHQKMVGAAMSELLPDAARQALSHVAAQLDPSDQGMDACKLRGLDISHREWLLDRRLRNQMAQHVRALFTEVDVVITPVFSTTAFPHDHSPGALNDVVGPQRRLHDGGEDISYKDQLAWSSFSVLFGLPATAAPIGLSDTGLPVGVQIIGDYLEDRTTIGFAHLMEVAFGGFTPPPILNKV